MQYNLTLCHVTMFFPIILGMVLLPGWIGKSSIVFGQNGNCFIINNILNCNKCLFCINPAGLLKQNQVFILRIEQKVKHELNVKRLLHVVSNSVRPYQPTSMICTRVYSLTLGKCDFGFGEKDAVCRWECYPILVLIIRKKACCVKQC